ncbi:MAG: TolC family protein [Gemmatimonadetes bacterium]|nr:TolC family protein [Gemmatimonadota bacterium]
MLTRMERRSPRVAAARALAEAARSRVPSARRPPDPQFQVGLMNYEVPRLSPMAAIGMTQLQVMQMVPLAGKLTLSGRIADAQADGVGARALDVRWEQRTRLAMAFYDLYQADRALRVARDTRRLLEDIATTAQTMYAVGDGRQADVLRARVEVARMHEEIERMATMRISMGARLGGVLDEAIDTTRLSPVLPDLPATLPTLESLVAEAQSRRPMVLAGEADVSAASTAEQLARREIWPDLQIGVQYGQRGGPLGTERMGSLMLGASIPIFARSRQLQMRAEAGAMRAMAQSELAAMRAETRARVAELHADFKRARNLRALYLTAVLPQAQAAVTSALASYRVGTVNLMTLLDNQMTVNRYQQELFVLDAELGKTVAELEMLVGRVLSAPPAPRDKE